MRYKILLLSSLVFLLFNCATTSFAPHGPCLKAIAKDSKFLVPWLPEKNTTFYLTALRRIYNKRGITIAYLPEEEWNLKASGVSNPLDSSGFTALQRAGYSHLLLVKELSNGAGNSYAYYTPEEVTLESSLYGQKPTWNERGNRSEIALKLIPLNDVKAAHQIVATTTINSLIVRGDDGGETYVNPTKVESARYKAIVKGSKRMLKECEGE